MLIQLFAAHAFNASEVLFLAAIPRDGVARSANQSKLLRCTVGAQAGSVLGPWVQPQESFALAEMPQLEAVQVGLRCRLGRELDSGAAITASLYYGAAASSVDVTLPQPRFTERQSTKSSERVSACVAPLFGHVPLFNFWLDHHFGAGVDAVVAYATGPLADAQLQARLNADPRVSVVSWPLHQRTGDVGGGPLQLSYYGQYSAYTDCVYRVASEWVFWADPDSFVATQQPLAAILQPLRRRHAYMPLMHLCGDNCLSEAGIAALSPARPPWSKDCSVGTTVSHNTKCVVDVHRAREARPFFFARVHKIHPQEGQGKPVRIAATHYHVRSNASLNGFMLRYGKADECNAFPFCAGSAETASELKLRCGGRVHQAARGMFMPHATPPMDATAVPAMQNTSVLYLLSPAVPRPELWEHSLQPIVEMLLNSSLLRGYYHHVHLVVNLDVPGPLAKAEGCAKRYLRSMATNERRLRVTLTSYEGNHSYSAATRSAFRAAKRERDRDGRAAIFMWIEDDWAVEWPRFVREVERPLAEFATTPFEQVGYLQLHTRSPNGAPFFFKAPFFAEVLRWFDEHPLVSSSARADCGPAPVGQRATSRLAHTIGSCNEALLDVDAIFGTAWASVKPHQGHGGKIVQVSRSLWLQGKCKLHPGECARDPRNLFYDVGRAWRDSLGIVKVSKYIRAAQTWTFNKTEAAARSRVCEVSRQPASFPGEASLARETGMPVMTRPP
jgi:hypothetical protein